MATIEKRTDRTGKTTYRVRIRMRGHDLSETFDRKTDATIWAKQKEAAISEQRLGGHKARKFTLGQLIDEYLASELKGRAEKDTRRHLKWWKEQLGGRKLGDLDTDTLRQTRNSLKLGRTPATVNRYHTSLSAALTTAVREWEWIPDNPMLRIRKLPEPRGRTTFLSDDQRSALLTACRESRNQHLYPIVLLALSTGMRQGEILNLTWDAVDLNRKRITLLETKNGDIRPVPLVGPIVGVLKDLKQGGQQDSPLLFPGKTGEQPVAFREAWLKALERAKIADFRFHDLRHTCASYLAMSGATPSELAEILGHKSLAMVKRYAHLSEQHSADVLGRMVEGRLTDE